jgi:hypothetical protein
MAAPTETSTKPQSPRVNERLYAHYLRTGFSDDVANAYSVQDPGQKILDELCDYNSEEDMDLEEPAPTPEHLLVFEMVNGYALVRCSRYCAYCALREGKPHSHLGFFVSVPTVQDIRDEWRKGLEVATHVRMTQSERKKFEDNVHKKCVRVATEHLALANGTYDRNQPIFIETQEPCKETPRKDRNYVRSQTRITNAEILRERATARTEEKKENKIADEKKKFLSVVSKIAPEKEFEIREEREKENELEKMVCLVEEKRRIEEELKELLKEREKEKEEREREKIEWEIERRKEKGEREKEERKREEEKRKREEEKRKREEEKRKREKEHYEREKELIREKEEEKRERDQVFERGERGKLNEKMRELVRRLVKNGASLRGASKMMGDVGDILFESSSFKAPCHSAVNDVVKEGAILAQLQSFSINHRMENRIMGQDSGSSRSKTFLGLSSSSPSETVLLGMKQIVDHGDSQMADTIQEMLQEFRELAQEFPETADFAKSLNVKSFKGVMSDHAPVNARVVKVLNEREGIKLDILGCSPHKGDLIETHLLSGMKSVRRMARVIEKENKKEGEEKEGERQKEGEEEGARQEEGEEEGARQEKGGEVTEEEGKERKKRRAKRKGNIKEGEEEEYIEDLVGMKVPKGARSYDCSIHFLFTSTNILAITGKDKYGFASKFDVYKTKIGYSAKNVAALQGNRFLIYSTTAFRVYDSLPIIATFAREWMNPNTWSAKFLVSGCESPQTLQELRILSLFAFGFSFPFQYSMEVYTVKQVSELWKVIEEMVIRWEGMEVMERKMEEFSQVWDLVKKNAGDEKEREKIEKKQKKKWDRLSKVFETLEEGDLSVWKSGMKKAREEVQKIAREYLKGGKFEIVSDEMGEFPGHNLFLESSFSVLKRWDTHGNHMSAKKLQGKVMEGLNPSLWPLHLSEESKAKVRKMAKHQQTEQERMQEINGKVVERMEREVEKGKEEKERKRKREEEREKKKEEEENKKRKKMEAREEKLRGVVLERDSGRVQRMKDADLKLQLMLWQDMWPDQKIAITMRKELKVDLVIKLIEYERAFFKK